MSRQKRVIRLRKVKRLVKVLNASTSDFNEKLAGLLESEGFMEAHAYSVQLMQKVVIPIARELSEELKGGVLK